MRKIKKLKRISIMLLCAVLLHGGCGSHTTEEIEKVDTTENFDLIGTEGWEYQGEKKQYIYGEWTVTGVRKGDTWDETDERVGAVYELLPESCSYKSSTESYSLKLEGYSASLISAREYDIAGMLPQDTNYCLEFSEVEMGRKYGGIKSAFTVLILFSPIFWWMETPGMSSTMNGLLTEKFRQKTLHSVPFIIICWVERAEKPVKNF